MLNEDWRDKAACKNIDPDFFFPGRGDSDMEQSAKAVCEICPVPNECLDFALVELPDCPGIWGGTTQRERRGIRKSRRRLGTLKVVNG